MTTDSKPSQNTSSNIIGGAAGAGGGTLLVLLAKNLPETNPWKLWLVIIAPSLSILLNAIYLWAKRRSDDFFLKKRLNLAVKEATLTLKEALNNSATSEAHKKELTREMEQLEMTTIRARLKRVEQLIK